MRPTRPIDIDLAERLQARTRRMAHMVVDLTLAPDEPIGRQMLWVQRRVNVGRLDQWADRDLRELAHGLVRAPGKQS